MQEIKDTVEFAKKMLGKFGFHDIQAYLSTKPAKAVGDPARWEQATQSLRDALDQEGMSYEVDTITVDTRHGSAEVGIQVELLESLAVEFRTGDEDTA